MERIRTVELKASLVIDTNKWTYRDDFEKGDHETIDDFVERIKAVYWARVQSIG